MSLTTWMAVAVFTVVFVLIATEWVNRVAAALGGAELAALLRLGLTKLRPVADRRRSHVPITWPTTRRGCGGERVGARAGHGIGRGAGHGDVTGSPQNRTYLFAGITAQANPACVSGPAVLTRTAACPGALPGAAGTPG